MNFHILTLFPEMVMGGLNTSITGRAIDKGLISVEAVNIRDYSKDKTPSCRRCALWRRRRYGDAAGTNFTMHMKIWRRAPENVRA